MNDLKNYTERAVFKKCLLEVEEKIGWGSSERWNTQDFEQLSDHITEETGVMLSSTTLKRLWGKVKYDSTPNISTLDVLAKFTGVENWRTYEQSNQQSKPIISKKNQVEQIIPEKRKVNWTWIPLAVLLLLVIGWYAFQQSSTISPLQESEFSFQSRRIAQGLPNSVVFEYDVSSANKNDKIEIQQSWDKSKRVKVSREDRIATSIYYMPGYFNAKLVVNDQVVKTHDVFIPTNGWLGLIERKPVPIYLEEEAINDSNTLRISDALLQERLTAYRPNDTWSSFFRVEDFGDLTVDNFTMETMVRNESVRSTSACQKVTITLLCSGEAIIIPLSIPGCVAENNILMLGDFVNGSKEDLSAFSSEFSDWVNVKCISKDGTINFFINQQLAYEMPIPREKKNKIMGIRYRFQGAGAIQDLRFEKDRKLIFSK